ncbi:MAG: signal recognition particle-docking protein FtsY [Candidatus Aenigmarchaeota archaeon]|nr:signal recognition particle-docking protein FtsY [Candidatus Aenigmarchaeota archaeon]
MFGFLKQKVKEVLDKVKVPSKEEKKKGEPKEKKKVVSEEKLPQKALKEESLPKAPASKVESFSTREPTATAKSKPGAEASTEKMREKEKKGFGFSLFSKKLSEKDLEELKIGLVRANMSYEAAEKIVEALRDTEKKAADEVLREQLIELLGTERFDLVKFVKDRMKTQKAVTILFFGFNGAGKTTTIAKIGHLLKKNGVPVVFAAGDTFRAAAIEQLSAHAKNLGIEIVKHKYGGDPAAVIFDAKKHAEKIHGVVLGDTAGRLHTDKGLMEELKKVMRVNSPDFKILVMDSLTGSDIVTQLENFSAIGFDGLIFTKVEINEKGGSIFSVRQHTDKPILFLGTGQGYGDLMEFDPEKIVEKLDL